MIEKWAEKVVFVQNVRGLTCVFETFDSPTRVNYAKNVNKSKKIETFCICLTFFYYLCRMFADGCIVPRRRIKRHICSNSLTESAPRQEK